MLEIHNFPSFLNEIKHFDYKFESKFYNLLWLLNTIKLE